MSVCSPLLVISFFFVRVVAVGVYPVNFFGGLRRTVFWETGVLFLVTGNKRFLGMIGGFSGCLC